MGIEVKQLDNSISIYIIIYMISNQSLFILFGGLFVMAGAYFEWDFFFKHRKAQFMVRVMGKKRARIFYFVFGFIIFLLGIGFRIGLIPEQI